MNANTPATPPLLVCRGRAETATYRDPQVPSYRDNLFIEALPPIWTTEEAARLLMRYPAYDEQDRAQPAELRLHLIQNAAQFFEPLPIHLDLEQRFSRVIRAGYQARNPLEPGFWHDVHTRVQSLRCDSRNPVCVRSTSVGFTILGISGVGKTTAVEAILSLYPQVIFHTRYRNRDFNWVQVVWLKLDCPFDGSTRGLCLNFFQALDSLLGTSYYDRYTRKGLATTDEMMPHMAQVCSLHGLGVFVIDEIQHLSEAKSGGSSKMLNFFVQLINTIGVPVILVGTYKALALLTGEFRQARRGTGQGDLVWDRMAEDDVWQLFVESLWRYQYVRTPTSLIPELSHALYEVSQGITDFAVKAYMLAQVRAITTDEECVRANIIRSVAADSFRLANPVLSALRRGDTRMLLNVEDVHPIDLEPYQQGALTNAPKVDRIGTPHTPGRGATPGKAEPTGTDSVESPAAVPIVQLGHDISKKSGPPASSKLDRNPSLLKCSLLELVSCKAKSKIAAYEALLPAYIRPATEYFAMEAAP